MDYLSNLAVLASGAVLLVEELLKLKIIPIGFANRYPVPTNIILSIVATILMIRPHWEMSNLPQIMAQIGVIALVAAMAYNHLLAKWGELREMEGE